MIRTLLPYLKPYRRQAILGPLSIILEVILEINIPILMSRIVDVGIPNKDLSTVIITGLFMILMALCWLSAAWAPEFFPRNFLQKQARVLPPACGELSSTGCRNFPFPTQINLPPPPLSPGLPLM